MAPGRRSRFESFGGLLSFLLPLGLYVATAAPAPTWLDSGEFLASGFVLGAAHPPGHPVLVVLIKVFSFIPLGPLAFRAAMASAVPAALACFLLFKLFVVISRDVDHGAPPWLSSVLGVVAALLLAATPALWAQATRVEVYAAQIALVLGVLIPLTAFSLQRRGARDGRLLAAASLAFGLSLANHHFLSFLLVPGAIVLLTEDALARWRRTVRLVARGSLPAITLGLVPYIHLVARSDAPGAVSLGAAPDASTFFWVVTARAYQKAVTDPPTTSFPERMYETAMLVTSQLGPVQATLALGGLYLLVRRQVALGLMMVLSLVASWTIRSWMGVDPGNPDMLGYLLIPVCLLSLGVARLGPVLAAEVPARATVRIGSATVVALALAGGAVFTVLDGWERNDQSARWEARIVAEHTLDPLPPHAVLITELFSSGFNVWAAQTTEGARPDVAHFHFPFVGYPGYVRQVQRAHRDLRGVLRAALASGELSEREVSALAQRRPVFLEPMIQGSGSIDRFLVPAGLVWEASAEPLSLTDLELSVTDHFARWDVLIVRLGDGVHEEQTLRVLLWRAYIDALLLARRGEREGSRGAAERALTLAPVTPELLGLRQALEQGTGPLDITPFLPRSAVTPRRAVPPPDETDRPDVLDF
jgi:Flp pilus assembly protein protease CpaA